MSESSAPSSTSDGIEPSSVGVYISRLTSSGSFPFLLAESLVDLSRAEIFRIQTTPSFQVSEEWVDFKIPSGWISWSPGVSRLMSSIPSEQIRADCTVVACAVLGRCHPVWIVATVPVLEGDFRRDEVVALDRDGLARSLCANPVLARRLASG